jgi:hypothetical protein
VSDPSLLGLAEPSGPRLRVRHPDPYFLGPASGPEALNSGVRTHSSWAGVLTQGSWVWRQGPDTWVKHPNPRLMGSALQPNPKLLDLAFKRGLILMGLVLQSSPLKFESCKFNIIVIIKNNIICIINMIIYIIINIINIIINKFEKYY